MSERRDMSNYASYIVSKFLYQNKTKLPFNLLHALQIYHSSYISYQQLCEESHPISWYIKRHQNSKNPIVYVKKIIKAHQLTRIQQQILELVLKMSEYEKSEQFQTILKLNYYGEVIGIIPEALNDGYLPRFWKG